MQLDNSEVVVTCMAVEYREREREREGMLQHRCVMDSLTFGFGTL